MNNLQNMNEFTIRNGEKKMLNSFNKKKDARYRYSSTSVYDKIIIYNNNIHIF